MIYELFLYTLLLFIFLELYEIQWQKASTLLGMLARIHSIYAKHLFLFFAMHPTFYFSIMLMLFTNYNLYAVLFFALKLLDIALKIVLIKQVFIEKEISQELSLALLGPLHPLMPYIGLTLYPMLLFLALL